MGYKYTNEYKQEAVRLALTSSQSIAKTARDLGVKASSLYAWISATKDLVSSSDNNNNNQANLVEELNHLRKENARLKEEREILKKAAAFFAKESK